MLNFRKIQHPKVNRQSPKSRSQARNNLGVSIRAANYWFIFFAPAVSKKRME